MGDTLALIVSSILCVVLLSLLVLGACTIGPYEFGKVDKNYNAEVERCTIAMEHLEDQERDFINNERTNTDNIFISNEVTVERCLAITQDPEYYLKGKYIGFWAEAILLNLFGLLLTIFLTWISKQFIEDFS